ncbi:hypothetical protein BDR26DRAFT_898593 [Obelidium mucronatum]|nr:hypothetical protein BDR26DRAFT_898593 [Obelidium mucronatum]
MPTLGAAYANIVPIQAAYIGGSLLFLLSCWLFCITATHRRTHCGIIPYLRQIGRPLVENVMFSYAWQDGLKDDIHCLAQGLIKNGIGVWIDVQNLISGDNSSEMTRTVAANAEFVVVVLTPLYINRSNCLSELYAALNVPNARNRVIFFCPNKSLYPVSEKNDDTPMPINSSKKVEDLKKRLRCQKFAVLENWPSLIRHLNETVIYSVNVSHFKWHVNFLSTYINSLQQVAEYTICLDFGTWSLVDCRLDPPDCVKPLLAANCFDVQIDPPWRWIGWDFEYRGKPGPKLKRVLSTKEGTLHHANQVAPSYTASVLHQASGTFLPMYNSEISMDLIESKYLGNVSVAVHSFDCKHPVAENLRDFLEYIGVKQPKSEKDYDQTFVMVHVFVFGGRERVAKQSSEDDEEAIDDEYQVKKFQEFRDHYKLNMDDCVLIACDAKKNDRNLSEIFRHSIQKKTKRGEGNQCKEKENDADGGLTLESFVFLSAWELKTDFAQAVLQTIGLRVKNSIKRAGKKLEEAQEGTL